ncbi:hypothetical protein [Sanguibacter sp. HDW7]|uniref:hypothetical protein n=1 Tax=Sanguibacter sp. HDW7 TaxID=2714931 RepID=UPI00140B0087|nr:hypothetical protein [Sanguibacter sp. HDW7]QIK82982.1 hypothetical protein G7063_04585 [Sanguibacter sp. HDW7]
MSAHDATPRHAVRADVGQGMQTLPGMSWSVDRTLSGVGLPGQARAATGSSLATGSLSILDSRTPWRGPAIAAGGAVHIDAALDAGASLTRVATMRSRSVDAAGARVLERGLSLEDDARGLLGPVASPASVPATPVDLSTVLVTLATSLGLAHDVAPSGVLVPAILPEGRTGWEICQWVARVTLGACWLSETGVLTYRGPAAMRGQGTPRETIHTLPQVVDLPWQVSTDDVADRVTLTYTPLLVERVTDASLTVWESTETLTVAAGATVVVEQDLETAVDGLAPWLPIWSTAAPEAQRSRWAASTQADGGGERPADSALTVAATLVTASRVRITVKNNAAVTLYVGGGQPTQLLIVRANARASRSAQVTLAAGVEASVSRSECSLDVGTGVSSEAEAHTLLAWLAAQTASPRATLSQIQVVPDLARRLGDLVEIVDPITGLSSRCIIAGVHLEAGAGSITQSLDLTLVDGVAPTPPAVIPVVTGSAGTSSSAGISAVERSRLDAMEREDRSQPSVPSAPTLTARLGVLSITWDGLSNTGGPVSDNLAYVEVALGDATAPTSVIDRIERGGGTVHVTGLPYNVLRYVRLRAVSRNRIPSAWGAERSQAVTPLVDTDLIGKVIAEANLGDDVVTARTIFAGAVTAEAIAALAVQAGHIAANAVTADTILAGAITGVKIAADAIDGKTITGATVRTAASGQRVILDAAGLRAHNAAGALVTSIALPGGTLSATGVSLTGTLTTTQGVAETVISAGKIRSTGLNGTSELSGSLEFYNGATNIGTLSPLNTTNMQLYASGNLSLRGAGGSINLLSDTAGPFVNIPDTAGRDYAPDGSGRSFITTLANGSLGRWVSGAATTPGGLTVTGSLYSGAFRATGNSYHDAYLISAGTYAYTGGSAANVGINTAGTFFRSTSRSDQKVAVEDAPAEWADAFWDLRPRTWIDRGDAERLADALAREAGVDPEGHITPVEDVEWDTVMVEPLRRIPGFVAEEVEAAGLAGLVTYDRDGEVSGLSYDRMLTAAVLAMRAERTARLELTVEVTDLTARLATLEAAA